MKGEGRRWVIVWCVALIMIEGCHRIDEKTPSSTRSGAKEGSSVSGKERSLVVPQEQEPTMLEPALETEEEIDRLWALFPEEPQRSFRAARRDFLDKKSRTASEKIRKSAMYVKLQTLRAHGPTKRELLESETALRSLSQGVAEGKVPSLKQLDTTFGSTQRAIARLHHEKAKTALARGDLQAVGIELQAAKDRMKKAAAWTGDHVDPAVIESSERAGAVADRLIKGTAQKSAELRKTLLELEMQLDRLDTTSEAEEAKGLFVGEAQFYMKQGEVAFEERDTKGASDNMRKAAACMALESFGAYTGARGTLKAEIEGLQQAGKEVEEGTLKSRKKLRQRFARAQYALARMHHLQAGHYHAQYYSRRALASLSAAVLSIERAAEWTDRKIKNSSGRVLQRIKSMSKTMREGGRVSPEEISDAITELKKVLTKMNSVAANSG